MVGKYTVVTLCGSTKFKNDFERVNRELTLAGNIVLSLACFGHADNEVWNKRTKEMLDDIQKRKIDMADMIYVINKDGYIGESTRLEINYAREKGKEIVFMEEK